MLQLNRTPAGLGVVCVADCCSGLNFADRVGLPLVELLVRPPCWLGVCLVYSRSQHFVAAPAIVTLNCCGGIGHPLGWCGLWLWLLHWDEFHC